MRRKSVRGSLYVPSREVFTQVFQLLTSLFPPSKMWLFKPNMRLSYKSSKHYLLPEHGTIQAAKVLFKVLGPSMSSMDLGSLLDRYPGFPQAEQLMYPKNTCTQIALLLKESNACYPEGMRSMTRLDVGWLLRA
jgi:ubiquitin-protein ligase E3 D